MIIIIFLLANIVTVFVVHKLPKGWKGTSFANEQALFIRLLLLTQRGRVEQAVAVPCGGERPQPLAGPRLSPPVEAAAGLQGDQRGQLDQVPLQERAVVICEYR